MSTAEVVITAIIILLLYGIGHLVYKAFKKTINGSPNDN